MNESMNLQEVDPGTCLGLMQDALTELNRAAAAAILWSWDQEDNEEEIREMSQSDFKRLADAHSRLCIVFDAIDRRQGRG